MSYKVSICVPIYNVEKYIERCAVSLFEQTYEEIEYVFVNDCTPDLSIDILLEVINRYPNRKKCVKIIQHEKNKGLSAARNTAVRNCTGDFVFHVDSDDYVTRCAIKCLVDRQMEADADIVSGQAICVKRNEMYILERPHFFCHEDMVKDMIKPSIHHTIWGRLIRKLLYDENNIKAKEGVDIGEDLQVMSQLAYYASRVDFVWDVVYYYNNTNEESYMNLFDGKNINRSVQDAKSMEVVRDFFKDKSEKFFDLAEIYLRDYYMRLMCLYGKMKLHDCFLKVKKQMLSLKPQNRILTMKQRFKYSNYYVLRFVELIKKR